MSTEALDQIAQAAKIVAPIGQGIVDSQTADANAATLRTQAGYARAGAAAQESMTRREGRAAIAQQVANQAANGAGFDSSSADVIRQNEVSSIADALAIRYRGQLEAQGYESKAAAVEYEGKQSLYGGIASAGTQLLMTEAEKRSQAKQLAAMAASRKRNMGVP
jgi:hypothetical protein